MRTDFHYTVRVFFKLQKERLKWVIGLNTIVTDSFPVVREFVVTFILTNQVRTTLF
jgi:hypothetical protein